MTAVPSIDSQIMAAITGQPARHIAESASAQAMGYLLIRDGLTGLYNRRYLRERLPMAIASAAAQRLPLSLLVMDLNGFKRTNDTLGHAAGDRLLTAAGQVIAGLVPADGIGVRYGGDEFVIVLPGWGSDDAEGWALTLTEQLSQVQITLDGGAAITGLGASIGVTTGQGENLEYAALFSAADQAMYHAKHNLGGGVCHDETLSGIRSAGERLRTGWLAPYVGRNAECSLLLSAAEQGGQLVCLYGPTGVGKSRLAAEAATLAQDRGWSVLGSHGGEISPLGGILDLLRNLSRLPEFASQLPKALADLAPEHCARLEALFQAAEDDAVWQSTPARPAAEYVDAVLQLICALAARQKLWIWIDDAHAWDETALALLAALATLPPPASLVVVASLNPDESPHAGAFVGAMVQMARDLLPVVTVSLGALSEVDAIALVRTIFVGDAAPNLIQALLDRCGGNPLALHSLVQHWVRSGRLTNVAGTWQLAGDAESPGAEGAPAIIDLPSEVRQLLEALAVAARPLHQESIVRLCGCTPAEVAPWLAEAQRRQVLLLQGGQYKFANMATRVLLATQAGALVRKAWHRLTAQLLASQRLGSAAELALHWEQAGDGEQAIRWHLQAAAAARQLHASPAVGSHFRRAAEMAADLPTYAGDRENWWLQAGAALQEAGNAEGALLCLRRALQPQAPPAHVATVLDQMAEAAVYAHRWEEGGQYISEALSLLAGAEPSALLARLYRRQSYVFCGRDGDYAAGERSARKSARIARQARCADETAAAYSMIAFACQLRGRARLAVRWGERAVAVPGLSPAYRELVTYNLAATHPDPSRGAEILDWVIAELSRLGNARALLITYDAYVTTLATLGRWQQARAAFAAWRRLAWRTGIIDDVVQAYAVWGEAALMQGHVEEVRQIVARCDQLRQGEPQSHRLLLRLKAGLALAEGQPRVAVDLVAGAAGDSTDGGRPTPRYSDVRLYLIAAAAAADLADPESANEWLTRARDLGSGYGSVSMSGRMAWLEGRIQALRNDPQRALAAYATARRPGVQPWDQVQALLSAAQLCQGTRPRRGCRLAQRAFDLATCLGFDGLIRAAGKLLAAMNPTVPDRTRDTHAHPAGETESRYPPSESGPALSSAVHP